MGHNIHSLNNWLNKSNEGIFCLSLGDEIWMDENNLLAIFEYANERFVNRTHLGTYLHFLFSMFSKEKS